MALQKINTDLISADAVTAAKIADGAIGADDIATNSITSVKIAQNSILTKHIDDDQIVTSHIADDQVTGDQLADAITVVTSVTSPLLVASTSARVTQVALTSTSNAVAWDSTAAANAYHVTTENTTFSAPSNAVEGAIIQVELAQGGTARTIAWNTVFEFAASTAPTVTATANKTDIFTFRYNGSVWQEIGRVQNLAQT